MGQGSRLVAEIVSWTIIAALIVLVVMNAKNFATAISSIGTFWGSETAMFTGSNYNTTNFGKAA